MSQTVTITRASRGSARTAFWVWSAVGALAISVAWAWFGLAIAEEASEQGKAEAAGTTMAGFAVLVGGVPLILAHVIGVARLSVFGWRAWHGAGLAYALLAVATVSLVGLGVGQLIHGGNLFYTAPVFTP